MARQRFFFDGWHPLFQLLFLFVTSMVFGVVFGRIGSILANPLFGVVGIDFDAIQKQPDALQPNEINALKLIQLLSSLGAFFLTATLFGYTKFPGGDYLRVRRRLKVNLLLLGMLILITSIPFVQLLVNLNQSVSFPPGMEESEKALRNFESANDTLILSFLNHHSFSDFVINLILIALIPALGEEMFFRGSVQQVLKQWLRNPHTSIVISSFFFASFHGQFFSFIPIFVLGLVLGYLFQWSRNLWINIAAHATFNGLQVLGDYLHDIGVSPLDVNGDYKIPALLIVISFVATVGLLVAFRKVNDRKAFIY